MSRKNSRRRSFQGYQSLEPRQMLASVAFDSGEVVVVGDASDDVIRLVGSADYRSFEVSVDNSPELTETFQYADVTKISVFAGAGNDRVLSTLVFDTFIYGGDGDDLLQGGYRNDLLSGGDGNDFMFGRHGDDAFNGGDGDDNMLGGSGEDRLFGFAGNDRLVGGNGNDVLVGGDGNDRVVGNAGDDLLNGNGGDDIISAGLGDDTANGGLGIDVIIGVAGTNTLNGNGDDDRIFGGNGADAIDGGSGDDLLAGGNGEDRIRGKAGVDTLFGGADNDILRGGDGNDFLYGQEGDDQLAGDDGDDSLFGNDGNDFLDLENNERAIGGGGVDRIFLSSKFDYRLDRVGNDIQITDLKSSDAANFLGQATVNSVEEVLLLAGDSPQVPIESLLWNPIVERVIVQPIIVSDDDGSNTATAFGNAEQEAEIKRRIDRIYNQAGIDVVFRATRQFNDTFSNGVGEGVRDVTEFSEIISRGDAAGVGSSDPLVVDYYFVSRSPGRETPFLDSAGRAFIGQSGAVQAHPEFTLESALFRGTVAGVMAHEIGHNLGLQHDNNSATPSLLTSGSTSRLLKDFQITQVLNSSISQPISEGGSSDSAAGISSAVDGDTGETGGCDCGVCGFCTGAITA